jgi:hypothetical protein
MAIGAIQALTDPNNVNTYGFTLSTSALNSNYGRNALNEQAAKIGSISNDRFMLDSKWRDYYEVRGNDVFERGTDTKVA